VTIYLDYQATTPLAPEAREAMLPWLGSDSGFANPHSPHRAGRAAAAAVAVARDAVAALLPADGTVYFTGGATESLNWAIKGCGRHHLLFPDTEHAAVRDTAMWLGRSGQSVSVINVDSEGLVDAASFDVPEALVAVMHVNNEIGVIQPIADIAARVHETGGLLLCDAVQSYGRLAVPEGPDMIAISAHKIHGPKGIGALWVRNGIALTPLLHGGGQEGGERSGTLSPALCAGFGAAARCARIQMEADQLHVARLWEIACDMLPQDWVINGSIEDRYRGNLNVRRDGLDVARLISEVREVAFSAGSACASGSGRSSHVLHAIGLSEKQARTSIRVGFGRYTSEMHLREGLTRIFSAAERH
jgi:cysteine desulfurase